jgi:transcriptional regulator with XRE-family HTH domain
MYLHSNLKFLRDYLHLTQAEFGNLFNLTRANIDSYERGIARPKQDKISAIALHFGLSIEVLLNKELKMNPGLLYAGASVQIQREGATDDTLKAKDETIKTLREQIRRLEEQVNYLQGQNDRLLKKLKVA